MKKLLIRPEPTDRYLSDEEIDFMRMSVERVIRFGEALCLGNGWVWEWVELDADTPVVVEAHATPSPPA